MLCDVWPPKLTVNGSLSMRSQSKFGFKRDRQIRFNDSPQFLKLTRNPSHPLSVLWGNENWPAVTLSLKSGVFSAYSNTIGSSPCHLNTCSAGCSYHEHRTAFFEVMIRIANSSSVSKIKDCQEEVQAVSCFHLYSRLGTGYLRSWEILSWPSAMYGRHYSERLCYPFLWEEDEANYNGTACQLNNCHS